MLAAARPGTGVAVGSCGDGADFDPESSDRRGNAETLASEGVCGHGWQTKPLGWRESDLRRDSC